ncbi:MAG: ScyD/ScyE family protein [Motilibacteraceae bacterium]
MGLRPQRTVLAAAGLAAVVPMLVAGQAVAASAPVAGADLSPVTKSLDLGPAGRILAARNTESGVQVVSVRPGTTKVQQVLATIPSSADAQATAAAAGGLGRTWVVYGGGESEWSTGVYLVNPSGSYRKVLSMSAYQASDPDPYDLEGAPGESNPYDVTALPDGTALVADAAGNDLVRVWPNGRAVTVACFPDELVSTADVPDGALPPGTQLPDALPAEAVPTGVAVDGSHAYVSQLKGFPFAVGSSKVYRVDAYGERQGCSGDPMHAVPPGPVVAQGLTAANDVSVGPDGGLYVTELSTLGVWAIEAGDSPGGGLDPSGTGDVVKVSDGTKTVAASGLTIPGSAVMGRDGHLYVTDMFLFATQLLAFD